MSPPGSHSTATTTGPIGRVPFSCCSAQTCTIPFLPPLGIFPLLCRLRALSFLHYIALDMPDSIQEKAKLVPFSPSSPSLQCSLFGIHFLEVHLASPAGDEGVNSQGGSVPPIKAGSRQTCLPHSSLIFSDSSNAGKLSRLSFQVLPVPMKHWAGQDNRPGDARVLCDAHRQFSPLLSTRFPLHLLSEAAGTIIHCFRAKNAAKSSAQPHQGSTPAAAAALFPAPAAALTVPWRGNHLSPALEPGGTLQP